MPDSHTSLPDFTRWPSFPFEGDLRVKKLDDPVDKEPPRKGEDAADCSACHAPDEAYIWVSERWRVRAMDRPTGLPMVLILESRSHLDLGDLPNLLAAELGVMTVRLERAIRSLDGVARVHVNRWGDGSAHLHMWFLARPHGRLQLRGTFLSLWDDILPPIAEAQWRENLALVAAWLAEFGGRPLAEPPRIDWHAPSTLAEAAALEKSADESADVSADAPTDRATDASSGQPTESADVSSGQPTDVRDGEADESPVGADPDAETESAKVHGEAAGADTGDATTDESGGDTADDSATAGAGRVDEPAGGAENRPPDAIPRARSAGDHAAVRST